VKQALMNKLKFAEDGGNNALPPVETFG